MMFKETKALMDKFVETTTAPIATFDQTLKDNPDLVLPLAALHASVIVAGIAATTAMICGHQQVRIAKEQTKQIRIKAMLEGHGRHRHGGYHHHKGPHALKHAMTFGSSD